VAPFLVIHKSEMMCTQCQSHMSALPPVDGLLRVTRLFSRDVRSYVSLTTSFALLSSRIPRNEACLR